MSSETRRFDFSDINLIPQKCIVESRADCDTSVNLGPHTFKLPVIPANMECVVNENIAEQLAMNGYFYVLHRFHGSALPFAKRMREKGLIVSISIGVNAVGGYHEMIAFQTAGIVPDYITIDIAHGHCVKMEKMLNYLITAYESSPVKPYIIAGNVSTPEAVKDLEFRGANAIKVGIGPGSACTTYTATGFGSRGAQACVIKACADARKKFTTKIIADGGIQTPGDIAKALVLGAHMVMIGGMFSALKDSPGNTVSGTDGRLYKEFWGSASAHQSGKTNRIEGTKKLMLMKNNTIQDEMNYIQECLQSAISYGGGKQLQDLKDVQYF
jgi:GMP reductase